LVAAVSAIALMVEKPILMSFAQNGISRPSQQVERASPNRGAAPQAGSGAPSQVGAEFGRQKEVGYLGGRGCGLSSTAPPSCWRFSRFVTKSFAACTDPQA
jgi:hypothetical protein